jgi:hypothetical protein
MFRSVAINRPLSSTIMMLARTQKNSHCWLHLQAMRIYYLEDWRRIKPIIREIEGKRTSINMSLSYIPREKNIVVDALARSAVQASDENRLFSCMNVDHHNSCHFQILVCNFHPWAKLCKFFVFNI